MRKIAIRVYGLACGGGGALTLERALAKLPGVLRVYVNPATETAYLEYDPERAGPEKFLATVQYLGYSSGPAGGER